ncbi:putative methyltransferase-domain-containing protein [Catenaria anguillulae PL171]|uniref:Putative methyltransferase-domain-containing protein n=1 Tax=Catenaria anguillulae PL171 TaxID=765915 RepID=A0A1Y2H611_9FUNG|nr:putative methyltransferase-domain-containing protein [Catenaria anguillulae PL171]
MGKSSKKKSSIVATGTRRRLNGVRSIPTSAAIFPPRPPQPTPTPSSTSNGRADDEDDSKADSCSLTTTSNKVIAKLPRKQKARKAITLFHAHTKHTGDLAALQHDSPVLNAYQQASMKINSTKYPSELLVGLLSCILSSRPSDQPSPSSLSSSANPPSALPAKLCSFELPDLLVPPTTLLSAVTSLPATGARLLDVGALEGPVAYRKSVAAGILSEVCSIDLHPQSKDVQQCDFFHYPLATPASSSKATDWTQYAVQPDPPSLSHFTTHQFDLVSLSLVVNFLPTPAARGAMLAKSIAHLDPCGLRLVYVVLPRACLDNSRYMTHARFVDVVMREALGCVLVAERWSSKLWCGLFHAQADRDGASASRKKAGKVAKVVVNEGGGRNNFAIVL